MERPQRQLGLTERSFRSPLGKRLQGYWYVQTPLNLDKSQLFYLRKISLTIIKKPNESLRYQKGTLPYVSI